MSRSADTQDSSSKIKLRRVAVPVKLLVLFPHLLLKVKAFPVALMPHTATTATIFTVHAPPLRPRPSAAVQILCHSGAAPQSSG